jgi:predicted TIM-barrel fold metal-dependent hydrolase
MSNRKRYEMTEEDFNQLLEACRPVPYMVFGGRPPRSPQENANDAWARLGKKMGFDGMTVEAIQGESERCFTAIPLEDSRE